MQVSLQSLSGHGAIHVMMVKSSKTKLRLEQMGAYSLIGTC